MMRNILESRGLVVLLLDTESTQDETVGVGRLVSVLDRALGLCLALASAPIVAGAAVVVVHLSGKSPFITHQRVGRRGKTLRVWKLRTMWGQKAANAGSFAWVERIVSEPDHDEKAHDDPRITSRFAAFCRRYSIDELPQLWHVVRGDMSLVGPRPLTRSELDRHYGARASRLLAVKPGLTGFWQVQGRSAIRFPDRAAMDLALAQDRSLRTYLKILVRTVSAVLGAKGAW